MHVCANTAQIDNHTKPNLQYDVCDTPLAMAHTKLPSQQNQTVHQETHYVLGFIFLEINLHQESERLNADKQRKAIQRHSALKQSALEKYLAHMPV